MVFTIFDVFARFCLCSFFVIISDILVNCSGVNELIKAIFKSFVHEFNFTCLSYESCLENNLSQVIHFITFLIFLYFIILK